MWSSNKLAKVRSNGNFYTSDYNTRKSYHYCQEYRYTLENYIRTYFSSIYNRWLSHTICFSSLKTGHINKHCPTRSKAPNSEFDKGKGKADVEHTRGEMKRMWKKRDDCNTSNGGITSPNRSSGHTSSN